MHVLLAALVVLIVTVAVPPRHAAAEQYTPEDVVAVVQPQLDSFWSYVFSRWGLPYQRPHNVLWYNIPGAPDPYSVCELKRPNSIYCPSEATVYLDYTLHTNLISAGGDNTSGAIFAHEWAHHIQLLLGVTHAWQAQQITTRSVELQADCFTGVFVRHLEYQGILEPGDLDEAATLMTAIGDDALGGPVNDPSGHGTSQERVAWFTYGYQTYNPGECDPYNHGF
jgi:hypothetical protein